ncbi:Uncharacterised protein [Edwardsiella hoshinae]|uniref:Uncharacterized protein n=2 Tax=Edwardsiella hoshinae TaxID=93378 RepID=A0A376IYK4_9GAMM|nr:Uncharacterised protein [Edwardsiella hoshinae]
MGDCGEDYSAIRERNKKNKNDRLQQNKDLINSSGIKYKVDSSGSMHFETPNGKVIFYPTTNKIQHKQESCLAVQRKQLITSISNGGSDDEQVDKQALRKAAMNATHGRGKRMNAEMC